MIKTSLILVVYAQALILAQPGPDGEPSVADSTLEQLCAMRENPDAWDELERRDIFSRRELRTIEEERIRAHISEEALLCFMGKPEHVVPVVTLPDRDWVDAYIYPTEEMESLVVHIRRRKDESTVVRMFETKDSVDSWNSIYRENGRCRTSEVQTTRCLFPNGFASGGYYGSTPGSMYPEQSTEPF